MLSLALLLNLASIHESDVHRFPQTARQAMHGWSVSSAHCAWLENYRAWDENWIADARWRYRCWDLLDDCKRIHPLDAGSCRGKLARLRLLIGQDAYWRGVMPDYLPCHRFTERGASQRP